MDEIGPIAEAFVRIRADTTGMKGEVEKGTRSAVLGAAKTAAGLVGAFGTFEFFKTAIEDASKEQTALTSLKTSIDKAGGSWKVHGKNLNEVLSQMEEATGTDLPELSQALVRLITATGSETTALRDLHLAQDIAIARHMGLAQAAIILARAEGGSDTALRRLGIIIPKVTTNVDALRKGHDQAAASGATFTKQQTLTYKQSLVNAAALDKEATRTKLISEIQARFGGQTARFAQTAAGQYARLHESIKNVLEDIGSALLPGLSDAAAGVRGFVHDLRTSESFQNALEGTVHGLGDAFHDAGVAIEFIRPPLEAAGRAAADVAKFMNAGGILTAVVAYKSFGLAVGAATKVETAWVSLLAIARGEQIAETASTGDDTAANRLHAASIGLETETLTANVTALESSTAALLARTAASERAAAASRLNVGVGASTAASSVVGAGVGTTAAREVEAVGAGAALTTTRLGEMRLAAGRVGSSLLRLVPPEVLGALGVAGLAFGVYKVITQESDWERANKTLRASIENLGIAISNLRIEQGRLKQTNLEIATLRAAKAAAVLAVERDKSALATSRAAKSSIEYRTLQNALATDEAQLANASYDLTKARTAAANSQDKIVRQHKAITDATNAEISLVNQLADARRKQAEGTITAAALGFRVYQMTEKQRAAAANRLRSDTRFSDQYTGAVKRFTDALHADAEAERKRHPEIARNIELLARYVAQINRFPTRRETQLVLRVHGLKDLQALRAELQPFEQGSKGDLGKGFALDIGEANNTIAKNVAKGLKDDAKDTAAAADTASRTVSVHIADYGKRVGNGVRDAARSLKGAQQNLADTITAGEQSINASVLSAKSNLSTIGQSLASAIGRFLDAGKPKKTDDKYTLTGRLKAEYESIKKQLAAGDLTPELEQRAKALESKLAQRSARAAAAGTGASATDKLDKEKTRVTRELADLTDLYNKHAISREKFEKRLTRILEKEHITRANIEKRLGVAAADEFTGLITGIHQQASALRAGPQREGAGLVPAIVKPLDALRDAQKADADAKQRVLEAQQSLAQQQLEEQKKIRELAKKQAEHLAKIQAAQKGTAFTATLVAGKQGDYTFSVKPQKKSIGGTVMGAGGIDQVPALLTRGEVVLTTGQQHGVRRALGMGPGTADQFFSTVKGFKHGGATTGGKAAPTYVPPGGVPLGRVDIPHVTSSLDHPAAHIYRWLNADKPRVPMRRVLDDWFRDRTGGGASPAGAIAAADWWRRRWPAQEKFAGGGIVGAVKSVVGAPVRAVKYLGGVEAHQNRYYAAQEALTKLLPHVEYTSGRVGRMAEFLAERDFRTAHAGGREYRYEDPAHKLLYARVADTRGHTAALEASASAVKLATGESVTRRFAHGGVTTGGTRPRTRGITYPVVESARQAPTKKLAPIPISEEDRIRFYAREAHASPKQTGRALDWYHGHSTDLAGKRFLGALGWATLLLPVASKFGVHPEVPAETTPAVHAATGALRGLPPKGAPSPEVQRTAAAYMREAGLPYHPPRTYTEVNERFAGRVARAFTRMRHAPEHPVVAKAYNALSKETVAQYHALVGRGFKFEFYPPGKNPYPSPWDAMRDLKANKHLYVYPTEAGYGQTGAANVTAHPLLADSGIKWGGKPASYNDIFRGVHDVFGHFKEGVGFRAAGEENAFRQHSAMFSPQAQKALASETRGQNSWVNFGPKGAKNRTAGQAETVYAEQKAGLLPWWALKFARGGAVGGDRAAPRSRKDKAALALIRQYESLATPGRRIGPKAPSVRSLASTALRLAGIDPGVVRQRLHGNFAAVGPGGRELKPGEMTTGTAFAPGSLGLRALEVARLTPVQFAEHPLTFWHGTEHGQLLDQAEVKTSGQGFHVGTYEAARQAVRARRGFEPGPYEHGAGRYEAARAYMRRWAGAEKAHLDGSYTYSQHRAHGIGDSHERVRFEGDFIDQLSYDQQHRGPREVGISWSAGAATRSGLGLKSSGHVIRPAPTFPRGEGSMHPVQITGRMSNTPRTPHSDFAANSRMRSLLARGKARSGYFYKNVSEDEGSVSAVLPSRAFVHTYEDFLGELGAPGFAHGAMASSERSVFEGMTRPQALEKYRDLDALYEAAVRKIEPTVDPYQGESGVMDIRGKMRTVKQEEARFRNMKSGKGGSGARYYEKQKSPKQEIRELAEDKLHKLVDEHPEEKFSKQIREHDRLKKHLYEQIPFAAGGVVPGFRAGGVVKGGRAGELVRAYENLPTDGGRLGPPVPSLKTLGRAALGIAGIDPGVVRARWDAAIHGHAAGALATLGPGGRPLRRGEVAGGVGPFGRLPKNLAEVLGREAQAYLEFWRIAKPRTTRRESAIAETIRGYHRTARQEAKNYGKDIQARPEDLTMRAAVKAIGHQFPELAPKLKPEHMYQASFRFHDAFTLPKTRSIRDRPQPGEEPLRNRLRFEHAAGDTPASIPEQAEFFVDELLRLGRGQAPLEAPARREVNTAAQLRQRFPDLQTAGQIRVEGPAATPPLTITRELGKLRRGDRFAATLGGPSREFKVLGRSMDLNQVSVGPVDSLGRRTGGSYALSPGRLVNKIVQSHDTMPGGRAGSFVQRLVDQELQPVRQTPKQLQDLLARRFATGGVAGGDQKKGSGVARTFGRLPMAAKQQRIIHGLQAGRLNYEQANSAWRFWRLGGGVPGFQPHAVPPQRPFSFLNALDSIVGSPFLLGVKPSTILKLSHIARDKHDPSRYQALVALGAVAARPGRSRVDEGLLEKSLVLPRAAKPRALPGGAKPIVETSGKSMFTVAVPPYSVEQAYLDATQFQGTAVALQAGHEHAKDFFIDNVSVATGLRKKGIGKQMYIEAGKEASRRGGRLYSSPYVTSPAAKWVWQSLSRDGLAERAAVPGSALKGGGALEGFVFTGGRRKPRREIDPKTVGDYIARGLPRTAAVNAARSEVAENARINAIGRIRPAQVGRGLIEQEIARQAKTRARFLPPGVNTTADMRGLYRNLDVAMREGLPISRHWYRDASKSIRHWAGGKTETARQLAALGAIYSPQQAVIPNIGLALRAMNEYRNTGAITVGSKWQKRAAELAVSGGDWREAVSGRAVKVKSFYGNLLEGISPRLARSEGYSGDEVTADGWMAALFGFGTQKARKAGDKLNTGNVNLSTAQYGFIERTVQNFARHYGVSPREAQAAMWISAKASRDRNLAAGYLKGGDERKAVLRRAGASFSEGLERREHQLRFAFEAASGAKSWQRKLTPAQMRGYTHDVGLSVLHNVQELGIPARLADEGDAPYINKAGQLSLNRAAAIELGVGNRPGKSGGRLSLGKGDAAFYEGLASAIATGLKQEGVGWLRPLVGKSQSETTAWRLSLGRQARRGELKRLANSLDSDRFYTTQSSDGLMIVETDPGAQLALKGRARRKAFEGASESAAMAVDKAFGGGAWDSLVREGKIKGFTHTGGNAEALARTHGNTGRSDLFERLADRLSRDVGHIDKHYRGLASERHATGGVAGAPLKFGLGGVVPGPSGAGDVIPSLLSPGELVVSRPDRGRIESGSRIAVKQRERLYDETHRQTKLLQRIEANQRAGDPAVRRLEETMKRKRDRHDGTANKNAVELAKAGVRV